MQTTVGSLLSARFGADVQVTALECLPHSQVWRCTIEADDAPVPKTVITRVLRNTPPRSHPGRLLNEQAALEYLDSVGCRLAPRFIAADVAAGILIAEDLGRHASVLDLLLGGDADAASQAFWDFARGLGELHAATIGRAGGYAAHRGRLGPLDPRAEHPAICPPLTETWERVRSAALELDLPQPKHGDGDIAEIGAKLADSGHFQALSSGDQSIVNCLALSPGVRFLDFENAAFRYAFLDAIVLRYAYPTGGPPWQLPDEVTASAERAYREALAPTCPEILADEVFERGMAAASAAWTLVRMARLPKVDAGPDRDPWLLLPANWSGTVPKRSRRRQLVAIIETCLASLEQARAFPALAGWLARTIESLHDRWPESTGELPLFTAFR